MRYISTGGPTDDFVPDELGLKIPTTPQTVRINDDQVFAMKPGDAMTRMSTHTFINEPSGQHLEQVLKYIYLHHNKKDLYNKLEAITIKNNWDHVVDIYEGVINEVQYREGTARFR